MTLRRFQPLTACSATLGDFVRHVISMSTQPKVGRVAARWVVTVVQHIHIRRDRAIGKFPRLAMDKDGFAMPPNTDIPTLASTTVMGPTSIGTAALIYPGPKAIWGSSVSGVATLAATIRPCLNCPPPKYHAAYGTGLLDPCPVVTSSPFTQMIGYNSHVSASLLGANQAGAIRVAPGLLMPNYTTCREIYT